MGMAARIRRRVMNETLESRLQAAVYEALRMVEQNEVVGADTAALTKVVELAEGMRDELRRLCSCL